jgi:hypothetical protein
MERKVMHTRRENLSPDAKRDRKFVLDEQPYHNFRNFLREIDVEKYDRVVPNTLRDIRNSPNRKVKKISSCGLVENPAKPGKKPRANHSHKLFYPVVFKRKPYAIHKDMQRVLSNALAPICS